MTVTDTITPGCDAADHEIVGELCEARTALACPRHLVCIMLACADHSPSLRRTAGREEHWLPTLGTLTAAAPLS